MATFSYPIAANFGASKSGLAASTGYKIISADGTARGSRVTSGITERVDAAGNATTGIFEAVITADSTWGVIRIIWDITGQAGALAEETIDLSKPRSVAAATYTQAIVANFGAAKTGQLSGSKIGYKVLGADGSTKISRTTTGITERVDSAGNAVTGVYEASPTFNRSWGVVRVVWDITTQVGAAAVESIDAADASSSGVTSPATPGTPVPRPYQTNSLSNFNTVWDQLVSEVLLMQSSVASLTSNQKSYFVQMYTRKIESVKELNTRAIEIMQDMNPQIALSKNVNLQN